MNSFVNLQGVHLGIFPGNKNISAGFLTEGRQPEFSSVKYKLRSGQ